MGQGNEKVYSGMFNICIHFGGVWAKGAFS